MKAISFIIPTFNNYLHTMDCVESILNLEDLINEDINYEIIVVDDFSDFTFYKKLKDKLNNLNFKNISILRNDKNMGPAFSRNKGAKFSKFDYIFFLDSDTKILNGSITNFLKKVEYYDAIVGIYDYKPLNNNTFAYHKAFLDYFYSKQNNDYNLSIFHAACAGIKKEVFNFLGGFNENIKWGMDYENEEFGNRIVNNNYKLIVSSKTMASHHFPDALNGIKLYFFRVSNWLVYYFNSKKTLDTKTATSPLVAFACLSCSASSFLLLFFLLVQSFYIKIFSLFFFIIYNLIFFKFFIFIFKKTKKKFIHIFLIHFIICNIIVAGALYGFFKLLNSKLLKINRNLA